jgi:hypothetical protein
MWTTCQSEENPSTEEYWHIGETAMRLASVRPRRVSGEKRSGFMSGWNFLIADGFEFG